MELLFLLFLSISFWLGQILSLDLANGVRLIPLDLGVGLFGLWNLFNFGQIDRYLKLCGWFIVVAILSLIWQFNRFGTIPIAISCLYLVRFIFYSFLIIVFSQPVYRRWGKQLLMVNGLGLAAVGWLQILFYPNLQNLSYLGWDPHQYRIFSTLLDPNFTGIIMVLTLFLTFTFLKQDNHKILSWQPPLTLFLIATFLALLLTYSRGSFLAFLAGTAIWLWLKKKLGLILPMLAVFILLLAFLPRSGGESVNLLRKTTIRARLENNLEAVSLWQKSPLIGFGFNTLRFIKQTASTEDLGHSGAGFHNSWLFLLITTGIIGFLSYLDMWQKIIKYKIIGKIYSEKNAYILASLSAIAVHSLFDNSLFYPWTMYWVFILIGSV